MTKDLETRRVEAPDIYEALKANGHSAAKAHEIMLDAKRGDHHAIQWVNIALKALPHG